MGKNFCSLPIWQRADIQNLQRTKTNLQERNKPIQKLVKDMNRHFIKEDIHEANKHEKCSLSLEKCQSKLHWDTISRQLEWQSLKNLETTDAGEDMEKQTLLHCWWECKLVQPPWKTVWQFLKDLKLKFHLTQQSHYWVYIQRIINRPTIRTQAYECSLQHCLQ